MTLSDADNGRSVKLWVHPGSRILFVRIFVMLVANKFLFGTYRAGQRSKPSKIIFHSHRADLLFTARLWSGLVSSGPGVRAWGEGSWLPAVAESLPNRPLVLVGGWCRQEPSPSTIYSHRAPTFLFVAARLCGLVRCKLGTRCTSFG